MATKDWKSLQALLYTFPDQEAPFTDYIDRLFPSDDPLDSSVRSALSFQAQSFFLALEELREVAASNGQERAAPKDGIQAS